MNGFIRAALGVGAVVAMTLGGMSSAAATEEGGNHRGSKPEVINIDEEFELPAGTACVDAIKVQETARITVTEINKNKAVVQYADWSRVTFYNPETDRRVTVGEGATAVAKYGEEDTRVTSVGKTVIIGEGVRGIVYVKGTVRFTVENDGTEDQQIAIHNVKGYQAELCKKLGTEPASG